MRNLTLAAGLLLLCAPGAALAQNEAPVQPAQLHDDNGPQQPSLITCWYNGNGAFAGSDSAQPGAQPGGPYAQSDGTFAYNIQAPNGQSCPKTKPGG